MIISYYIPEDGDTPEHPNFFISDTNTLSLGQLKKIFPVPGEYHFRFKKVIGSTSVWMDATNDSLAVPVDSNGNVFSKVSRISTKGVISQNNISIPNRTTSTTSQESLLPTSPNAEIIQTQSPQQSQSQQQQQPLIETKTRERRNSDKLLSFDNFDEPAQSPSVPVAAAFSNDFLDFSAPTTTAPMSNTNNNIDLFGFDNLSSTPINPSQPVTRSQSGNSMASYGQTSGTGSPMSINGMNRAPMGGSGPMGGRGNNLMGFDAFNNMTPTQSQGTYRGPGQTGRR